MNNVLIVHTSWYEKYISQMINLSFERYIFHTMKYELSIHYSFINPVISMSKPDTALYFVGVPKTVICFRFNALRI